jgi:hypothetical protein
MLVLIWFLTNDLEPIILAKSAGVDYMVSFLNQFCLDNTFFMWDIEW